MDQRRLGRVGLVAQVADVSTTRPWEESTRRQESDQWGADLYPESDRVIVDAVGAVAERRGVSRAQVALAWLLHQPVVTSPIVGVTRMGHLTDAVAAVDLVLSADELAELEAGYLPRAVSGHA